MSKKGKNNKKDKKNESTDNKRIELLAQMYPMEFDDEGFAMLMPTEEGEERLNDIRERRSKNEATAPTPEPEKTRAYEDYNAGKVTANLNNVISKVKAGKFKKALSLRDKEQVEALVSAFINMDADLPNFPKVCEAITKLIRIGKTFYEYSDGMEFIDNVAYDGVIARYRALGMTEPQEYVPDDKSGKKSKVKVKYPTLHNTMDKAYAIRSGDKIPDGVKESDRIEDFLKRVYTKLGLSSEASITLELSPKIDGVSVNGTIQNTKNDTAVLLSPQTRGDETESMKVIGMDRLSIAKSITDGTFGIQYEAFVTNEDCKKASEYLGLESPYKSNRHAASGIINRLCNTEDDNLVMFISLYPIESSGLEGTYAERMDLLDSYGIVPDDMIKRKIIKGNMTELLDKIEKRFNKMNAMREKLSYAIDGMVITVVDDEYQQTLGRNGRTNLYQIALKFDPASANAEVAGIHLDRGNKGYRTIQVDLKHPVYLDGVRYDHVPVLSAGLFDDLGLRTGSIVNVHRVGDVIPAISMVKSGSESLIKLPEKCPYCKKRLTIKNKKLYCNNVLCKGNLIGRILSFLDGIGMEGYGSSFVTMIVETFQDSHVNLSSLAELFDLTPEVFEKAGITMKLAREFLDTMIDAVAKTPDYKILGSIGIPDLGPARAKLILKAFGSWDEFMKSLCTHNSSVVKPRLAFGCKSAGPSLITGADSDSDRAERMYRTFYSGTLGGTVCHELRIISQHMKTFTSNFNDLITVGHTGGSLSQRVTDVCRKQNFDITDGKSFDVLITANLESDSGKMKTAKKKGVPILTEAQFLERYDRN